MNSRPEIAMRRNTGPAGLTYAPPYHAPDEPDPKDEVPASEELRKFAWIKEQEAKRLFRARAALIGVIFLMLAANMWFTASSQQAIVESVDQARLDQADLTDTVQKQMDGLQQELAALREAVDARSAAAPEEAEAAER